jgi:putative transposase
MTRPLRIEYPGAWYHVMNRGACRQPIFKYRQHFDMFLTLLEEISLKFQIEVHAYCLMDNHYHLLLHTPKANLSRAMQHLSSLYTMRYNRLEKRTDGPLFRGRFKSKIIESENYLIQVSRYIHLNPYKAKMVKKLEQYEWSSFPAYINKASSPAWLYKAETLGYFESDNIPNQIYQFTMQGNLDEFEEKFFSDKSPPIIGSQEFVEDIKSKKSYHSISTEIMGKKYFRPSINDIIEVVSTVTGKDYGDICSKKRCCVNAPREIVIYIAKNNYAYKLDEIAEKLNMKACSSVSSSTSRTSSRIRVNPTYEDMYVRSFKLLLNDNDNNN